MTRLRTECAEGVRMWMLELFFVVKLKDYGKQINDKSQLVVKV